ncbi:MAG: hypothetical protein JWR24_251 [Actinoallomurus sp.]|nr:hypothetical protein [Actinoallomurus sp.]
MTEITVIRPIVASVAPEIEASAEVRVTPSPRRLDQRMGKLR